jgi:aminoglycoside phosphotransferase (APT) family kinase protein
MPVVKMHIDELDIDAALVRRLLAAQFPQWAGLPIESVPSAGTDNALFRLGNDMAVRLPRIHWAVKDVEKNHHWLPRIAPFLPLAIPVPLARGEPGEGYPWQWSVFSWLEGESATPENIIDPCQAASDLAQFIAALQQVDTAGGPTAAESNVRGMPLDKRDTDTRNAIAALRGMIDTNVATKLWDDALQVPGWERQPVWFHGDILPGNLLVEHGRVSAVIDFGGLAVGDPSCDLMIAWGLFSGESREVFRTALQLDDATWMRGRAHALSQAVIFIPYYLNTNPVGVAGARHMLAEVLAEYQAGK